MKRKLDLNKEKQSTLETIFKDHGYEDYKWFDPEQVVVSQWVRTKCMFGCPNYGNKAACPPQTPSVSECERFFKEYKIAVIFHIRKQSSIQKERYAWYKKETIKLAKLERDVFLAGFEKAFFLLFGGCVICEDCQKERSLCKHPEMARPAPEAMAVDVFSTVKKIGYPISVLTDTSQAMDRYVFLMVQ
jgi:predicted metal-binding protein